MMHENISIVGAGDWKCRSDLRRMPISALYSSAVGCITTDPDAMTIPIDDHLVSRGDGVFEALRCVNSHIYDLDAHLDRLDKSCRSVGITMPVQRDALVSIIKQTVRASKLRPHAYIRILVSRGAGTMGINPYECSGELIYIVVSPVSPSTVTATDPVPTGLKAIMSAIPMKSGLFATTKTCNYLPNVLMKKEAIDRGVDISISVDENGNLAEGATENCGIVTNDNVLLMPPQERVLEGTTAKKIMKLAQYLVASGELKEAKYSHIPLEYVESAREMHVYGTSCLISPICQFDNKIFDKHRPILEKLHKLLAKPSLCTSSTCVWGEIDKFETC